MSNANYSLELCSTFGIQKQILAENHTPKVIQYEERYTKANSD